MSKLAPVSDAALRDILIHCSQMPWGLSSDEKNNFYLFERDTLPLRKVVQEFPYGTKGYDMRLMALAPELALEVLQLRKEVRDLKDKVKK